MQFDGAQEFMGARRARWVVLAGLVLRRQPGVLVQQQARVLVGAGLNVAFDNADTEFGMVWVDFSGDVIAKDVVLYAQAPARRRGRRRRHRRGRQRAALRALARAHGRGLVFSRATCSTASSKRAGRWLQLKFEGFDTARAWSRRSARWARSVR
jgi:hypothetical protein